MDERMFNCEMGRRESVAGVHYQETRHREPFAMGVHAHAEAHFALILDGLAESRYGPVTHSAPRATLSYTPPEMEHASRYLMPVSAFYISVGRASVDRLETPFEVTEGPLTALAGRIHREYRDQDRSGPRIVEEAMLELLAGMVGFRIPDEDGPVPRWLHRAREALHGDPGNLQSIDQIAHTVGVHPVHLMRSFRRFFGCTLGGYSRRLRVEAVCRRLRENPRLPLGELAHEMGFPDQQYLSQSFRRLVGLTPSEYRRILLHWPS